MRKTDCVMHATTVCLSVTWLATNCYQWRELMSIIGSNSSTQRLARALTSVDGIKKRIDQLYGGRYSTQCPSFWSFVFVSHRNDRLLLREEEVLVVSSYFYCSRVDGEGNSRTDRIVALLSWFSGHVRSAADGTRNKLPRCWCRCWSLTYIQLAKEEEEEEEWTDDQSLWLGSRKRNNFLPPRTGPYSSYLPPL